MKPASEYEHKVYLSDGTVLSQHQYDELYEKGELTLADGRKLTADARFKSEYLWARDHILPAFRIPSAK